ncbi:MAG TPA: hypothetical protein VEQ84_11685 [Vicinamibacteria bacterium]|nr:hypothetical protein [Vicinamibacteria bacterium]
MNRLATVAAVSLTFALPGLGAAQEPLAVHVSGSSPKATSKEGEAQLKDKKDAARKAYLDLLETGKKEHGKKIEAWPADKQDQLAAVRDAFVEAQIDWFYSSGLKQKDLDDSVREVSEALGKKPVRMASGPADADLEVQVVGRAKVETDELSSPNPLVPKNSAAELVLRVAPGGRLDAAMLAKSGASWSAKKAFWGHADTQTVHAFSVEAPYWLLIARKPGTAWVSSYKGVAGQAADAIAKFGAENADKVAASRKTK